jgi:hypothetical protein
MFPVPQQMCDLRRDIVSQTLVDLGATQVWKAAADIIDAGSVED